MFCLGIDMAKRNHEAPIIDENGALLCESISFSNWKRKLTCLSDQVFPEYDAMFSETFGVTSKEILSQYPAPEDMLNVSTKKLRTLLNKASKGKFGEAKALELKINAKPSFGITITRDAFFLSNKTNYCTDFLY